MTAATISPTPATRTPPSFGRVTSVELRKMIDTRAGLWLILAIGSLNFLAVFVTLLSGTSASHTFPHLLHNALEPSYFLLPVIGVLLVTSEFSQRTALTTFALVPDRSRVLHAKLAAGIGFSLGALAVGIVAALLGVALAGHPAHVELALVPQCFLFLAALILIGIAFGTVALLSAPAIVAILLLPNAFSVITNDIHGLHRLGDWLNPSTSLDHLPAHALNGAEWAQVMTTLAVWLAVPLALGTRRLLRRSLD